MIISNGTAFAVCTQSCREMHYGEVRLINGKPYTLRGVRTVWRGALGNLFKKLSKAPGSYPTLKKRFDGRLLPSSVFTTILPGIRHLPGKI